MPAKTTYRLLLRKWIAVSILIGFPHISSLAAAESNQPVDPPREEVRIENSRSQEPPVGLNNEYFKEYLTDTKDILIAPWRWEASDWIKASAVLGITAGLYTQDEKIQAWVQRNKNDTTGNIVTYAKRIGSLSLPALAGLYAYGSFADDGKAKTTVLLSIESFVVTGVFVQTLKRLGHRHRPYTGDPYNTWDGPGSSGLSDTTSFPSGDASSAFAVASVVASEYENTTLVPSLVYGTATLIALGRVQSNAHWLSDVFFGSAVGYFTGKAIVHAHGGQNEHNFAVVPVIDEKYYGLLATYKY